MSKNNNKKLFCPKCGEEIDKNTYVAQVRETTFYYCDLCDTEVYVIHEDDKEIKIGW